MRLQDLRSWLKDPVVPTWRKGVLVGAVLYVLMPFDLVPDFVPLTGWVDDAGVVGAAVAALLSDVRRHAEARAGARAGR